MKCMYEWTRRSVYGYGYRVDEGTEFNYQTTIVHVADLI
jgi:hypothetical protein